jgi:hypothetical protein
MSSRIEKVEQLAQRAYNRIFVTNGDPALIQEIKDIGAEINQVRTTAGEALEIAEKNRKFCGLKAGYDPASEGVVCAMQDITEAINFFKKAWKPALFILGFIFLAMFCLSAYNGTQQYKQILEMTAAVKQLKADVAEITKQ